MPEVSDGDLVKRLARFVIRGYKETGTTYPYTEPISDVNKARSRGFDEGYEAAYNELYAEFKDDISVYLNAIN